MREWVPEGHLIWFLSDVVDSLDLSAIMRTYQKDDLRGRAGYHPAMMVKLILSADGHPDHDSLADFRRRHLPALADLFLQVLRLCQQAGLVKLGHVALDGSKVKANASKHKAMSYERMCRTEADLTRRESRLRKIREAKAALEAEAREQAEAKAADARQRIAEREAKEKDRGRKFGGRPPTVPDPDTAKPKPKAQRNFTAADSRIMVDGATKSFVQAYNAHAAVDEHSQVIVAATLTQRANDKQDFLPLLTQIEENLGALPRRVSADSGFFSETNLSDPLLSGVTCYVPPEQSVKEPALAEAMRERLASEEGRAVYARRKAMVEPVFGQIKEARGFRRFSLRGLCAVQAEWRLVCLTHHLLKLFRAQAGIERGSGGRKPRPQAWREHRERICPCFQSALASAS